MLDHLILTLEIIKHVSSPFFIMINKR